MTAIFQLDMRLTACYTTNLIGTGRCNNKRCQDDEVLTADDEATGRLDASTRVPRFHLVAAGVVVLYFLDAEYRNVLVGDVAHLVLVALVQFTTLPHPATPTSYICVGRSVNLFIKAVCETVMYMICTNIIIQKE